MSTKARQAKQLVARLLDEQGLEYEKLTARTVDFGDLARASAVFVTIHPAVNPPRDLFKVKASLKGTGVFINPNY